MSDSYFDLADEDKRQILANASDELGIREDLLEKDIWICWALDALFSMPESSKHPMAFKGEFQNVSVIYNSGNFTGFLAFTFLVTVQIIYNSRNFTGFLALIQIRNRLCIYNSRNFTGFLASAIFSASSGIYNSRNFTGFLAVDYLKDKTSSTTVEISPAS